MTKKITIGKFKGVEEMLKIKSDVSAQLAKNPDKILDRLNAITKKYNLDSSNRTKLSVV